MFSALLFVHQDANAQALEQLVIEFGQISIQRVFTNIPPSFELTIQLNTWSPDLIFLDLSDWDYAVELAAAFRAGHPEIPIVGFGAGWADEIRVRCVEAGITNILTAPVTMKVLEDCIHRAIHGSEVPVQDNLVAFLPAKAGNGCTTVALNAAGCLAKSLGKKVLLIESDLNSGVLSVLLKTTFHHSLLDALEKSDHLDYSSWNNCVVKKHGIDVVLADRSKPFPSWSNYLHLLQFIKSQYDLIIVDLPEVVNDATEEIVRRAKYVFTVCTPETTSLNLAQRRCRELEGRGISADRVGIIVNRWHPKDMPESQIEDQLEHGVAAIFPNDYASVQAAAQEGGMVSRHTELGKTFLAFAKILAGIPEPKEPVKSRFEFLRNLRNRSPFKTPLPLLRS
jgi:Flp pilus assembly CpaE family ATPase